MKDAEVADVLLKKLVFCRCNVVCAGEQGPVINRIKTKPQNLFQKNIVLLLWM
jgi:hypothetical protein